MKTPWVPPGVAVATVLCGACSAEHRRNPARLGQLRKSGDTLMWHAYDPRKTREFRRRGAAMHSGEAVASIEYLDHAPAHPPPEFLTARCRYHGVGRVSRMSVMQARGTVTLNFTATRSAR